MVLQEQSGFKWLGNKGSFIDRYLTTIIAKCELVFKMFKIFYGFTPLQEKDQRSLDLNTAKCMLGLLLGKTWPLFPVFNQFLEVNILIFTVDQCHFNNFTRPVKCLDTFVHSLLLLFFLHFRII